MTQPPDDGTLSTGLATVQIVQQGDGSATLVVNGVDLSKSARRVLLDVDGRGPARATVVVDGGVSFEGPGVVTVQQQASAVASGAATLEQVAEIVAGLPWDDLLVEAMNGAMDDVPAALLRDRVLAGLAKAWGQPDGD